MLSSTSYIPYLDSILHTFLILNLTSSLSPIFIFFQFFHLNIVTGYKYIYMRQGVIVEDVGGIFISDACDKVGSPDPVDTYIAQYPGLGRPGYGMSISTC